jgi:hypothetical protein
MAAVLRDYGEEMVLPALEIYTDGLMSDSHMYEAFLAQQEQANKQGETHDDDGSATS